MTPAFRFFIPLLARSASSKAASHDEEFSALLRHESSSASKPPLITPPSRRKRGTESATAAISSAASSVVSQSGISVASASSSAANALISGTKFSVSLMTSISEGEPMLRVMRDRDLPMSRQPASRSPRRARSRGSPASRSTISCRASIAAISCSGEVIQSLSIRLPIGVRQRLSTQNNEVVL